MNRPLLLPGLPRVWRDDTELQLGADPARAVLLRLPDPRAAEILDLLDGTRPERLVLLRAVELGIPADQARAVLEFLHAAGLALPAAALIPRTSTGTVHQRLVGEATALAFHDRRAAPIPRHVPPALRSGRAPTTTLRRRQVASVLITGRGRLGAPIAVALAEAGVGNVWADVPGSVHEDELSGGPFRKSTIGTPRGEAIAAAVTQAMPDTNTRHPRTARPSLVVQLDHDRPAALVAAAHAARRQPHLAVTIRDGAAVIGPLVPMTGGPCLACLELHRLDRDASWPGAPRSLTPEPCTVTTLLTATAYATAEALAYVDGDIPETLGASIEITGPGRFRRRTWPPHPLCDCSHRPARAQRKTQPPTEGNNTRRPRATKGDGTRAAAPSTTRHPPEGAGKGRSRARPAAPSTTQQPPEGTGQESNGTRAPAPTRHAAATGSPPAPPRSAPPD
ncbi:hypothetical protein ACFY36_22815 [Actinoplanes sp. NPDC000266]